MIDKLPNSERIIHSLNCIETNDLEKFQTGFKILSSLSGQHDWKNDKNKKNKLFSSFIGKNSNGNSNNGSNWDTDYIINKWRHPETKMPFLTFVLFQHEFNSEMFKTALKYCVCNT